MQIAKNTVAGIHYTLRDNSGTIIDTSDGREPLYYLHGAGNLIIGMEEGLEGKAKGDKFQLENSCSKRVWRKGSFYDTKSSALGLWRSGSKKRNEIFHRPWCCGYSNRCRT